MTLADRIAVFMEGHIAQVGTPREVFARPQTVAVAGFVGTPQMNLMPGTWSGNSVGIDGHALDVSRASPEPREVTLGIRPNELRFAASGLPARVGRVEDLGDSAIVTLIAGARSLKLKTDRLPAVRPDEAVHVTFAPEAVHLFDARTGIRL